MVCPIPQRISLRNRANVHAEDSAGYFVRPSLWVTIFRKYVNSADLNRMPITSIRDRVDSPDTAPVREAGEPVFDLIELLFFAYRDFVGDADEALAKFGFGRAHHRVLHFVT